MQLKREQQQQCVPVLYRSCTLVMFCACRCSWFAWVTLCKHQDQQLVTDWEGWDLASKQRWLPQQPNRTVQAEERQLISMFHANHLVMRKPYLKRVERLGCRQRCLNPCCSKAKLLGGVRLRL